MPYSLYSELNSILVEIKSFNGMVKRRGYGIVHYIVRCRPMSSWALDYSGILTKRNDI